MDSAMRYRRHPPTIEMKNWSGYTCRTSSRFFKLIIRGQNIMPKAKTFIIISLGKRDQDRCDNKAHPRPTSIIKIAPTMA
ncbi:hypothetical protein D3C73_1553950 [compost metagenome]